MLPPMVGVQPPPGGESSGLAVGLVVVPRNCRWPKDATGPLRKLSANARRTTIPVLSAASAGVIHASASIRPPAIAIEALWNMVYVPPGHERSAFTEGPLSIGIRCHLAAHVRHRSWPEATPLARSD